MEVFSKSWQSKLSIFTILIALLSQSKIEAFAPIIFDPAHPFSSAPFTDNNLNDILMVQSGVQNKIQNEPNDPNDIIPLVRTGQGPLVGQALKSRTGKWYYAFEGVPYAETPKRFQPSTLAKAWNGTLDARAPRSVCPQMGEGSSGVIGDENCLYLNVYFPHYDRCQNLEALPVLFVVHGGAYSSGAGSGFGTKFFLDECLVFVSPNYRLGVLGFLTTEDGLIPGNLGLKDLVVALNWTRQFIPRFRGDSNSVTLMGLSAGASAVTHLVASPMAKGLFHRAIAHSGAALNPWSVMKNPNAYAIVLADQLGCPKDSTATFKSCVEKKDVKDIVTKQSATGIPFAPVVEPVSTEFPFQTQKPAVRLRNGDFNRVPLIIGFVQDESIITDPNAISNLNNYWNQAAPFYFFYNQLGFSDDEKNKISRKIRDFYFGTKTIGPETRQNITNLYSDRYFVQGIFETVELHSKFAPAYSYVMTYKGGVSNAWSAGYRIPAITHGDEAQYFFNYVDMPVGSEQDGFSRSLVKIWTNFMKTGISSGGDQDSQKWLAVDSNQRANAQWYRLDVPSTYFTSYLEDRRKFWENLGIYAREL